MEISQIAIMKKLRLVKRNIGYTFRVFAEQDTYLVFRRLASFSLAAFICGLMYNHLFIAVAPNQITIK